MTVSPVTRGVLKLMPSMISRPLAFRKTRRIAQRYLNGNVRRVGQFMLLEVPRSVTLGVAPGSTGCAFYESTLRELLRLLVGHDGLGGAHALRGSRRGVVRVARRLARRGSDELQLTPRLMLTPETLPAIQRALADAKLDGWLLFDFQGTNPIVGGMLALKGMLSRRIFVWIPREGVPHALGHAIERGPMANLAGSVDQVGVQLLAQPRELRERHGERQADRDGVLGRRRGAVSRPRAGRRARDGARGGRDVDRVERRAGDAVLRDVERGRHRVARARRRGDRDDRAARRS